MWFPVCIRSYFTRDYFYDTAYCFVFPFVGEIFDENGQVKDKETQLRRLEKMSEELIWMTKVLKKGREEEL